MTITGSKTNLLKFASSTRDNLHSYKELLGRRIRERLDNVWEEASNRAYQNLGSEKANSSEKITSRIGRLISNHPGRTALLATALLGGASLYGYHNERKKQDRFLANIPKGTRFKKEFSKIDVIKNVNSATPKNSQYNTMLKEMLALSPGISLGILAHNAYKHKHGFNPFVTGATIFGPSILYGTGKGLANSDNRLSSLREQALKKLNRILALNKENKYGDNLRGG